MKLVEVERSSGYVLRAGDQAQSRGSSLAGVLVWPGQEALSLPSCSLDHGAVMDGLVHRPQLFRYLRLVFKQLNSDHIVIQAQRGLQYAGHLFQIHRNTPLCSLCGGNFCLAL